MGFRRNLHNTSAFAESLSCCMTREFIASDYLYNCRRRWSSKSVFAALMGLSGWNKRTSGSFLCVRPIQLADHNDQLFDNSGALREFEVSVERKGVSSGRRELAPLRHTKYPSISVPHVYTLGVRASWGCFRLLHFQQTHRVFIQKEYRLC